MSARATRRALGHRLAHLGRLLGAGLFLATCGVASYTAGARHRADPAPNRIADPVCPR
ncbi:hypothetical protein [Methylobacterium sp. CCH5-D2]|uniref:hypothetical protein n=1 Tax=Methylobacterium sp. CCH5-D2 TaxID=1768765 RepID=UPI000AB5A2D1|nr:hypothetical protein [Methylobacterium sp. CCH5-D2]